MFPPNFEFYQLLGALRRGRRFVRAPEVERYLKAIKASASTRIRDLEVGSRYFRAQLGPQPDHRTTRAPRAHPKGRMIPTPGLASEGRVNPIGNPCLYLATDQATAIAEVRPWKGAFVTLATFTPRRRLRVVDCVADLDSVRASIRGVAEKEEITRERRAWVGINVAFASPVNVTDSRLDYIPTQLLAELFASAGYDGIWYESSLTSRYNIALFDVQAARVVRRTLHEVREVTYRTKQAVAKRGTKRIRNA